jgi:alpha-1,2-mannosyltransferase
LGEQACRRQQAASTFPLTRPRLVCSPQFALRSYLYLLLHAALLLPVRALLGSAAGKRLAFHALRAMLGAACAAAETALCLAAARVGGRRLGLMLWLLLLTGSGMFTSATTFLPSTFTMVAFAAAAALSLRGRRLMAVSVCVAGGLIGWPFAGLAAVPLGLHALASAGVLPTAATVLGTAVCVMLPSVAMDRLFYGQATVRRAAPLTALL